MREVCARVRTWPVHCLLALATTPVPICLHPSQRAAMPPACACARRGARECLLSAYSHRPTKTPCLPPATGLWFPPGLCYLSQLTKLAISGASPLDQGQALELPLQFTRLSGLRSLNLKDCCLAALPPGVAGGPQRSTWRHQALPPLRPCRRGPRPGPLVQAAAALLLLGGRRASAQRLSCRAREQKHGRCVCTPCRAAPPAQAAARV